MTDTTKISLMILGLTSTALALGWFIFTTSGWGALTVYIIVLAIIAIMAG